MDRGAKGGWRELGTWALAGCLAGAALASGCFLAAPRPPVLSLDERDYLRAAVHLARDGVISHAPVERRASAGDAYREPAYPALLALGWKVTGADLDFEEDGFARSPQAASARRVARGLHLLLLGAAAAAAAFAVRGLGSGSLAAAFAGVAVLASPALAHSGSLLASENLAAPLVAGCGALLVASSARPGAGWAAAGAGLAAGLLALTRGAGGIVALVGLALLAVVPRGLAGPVRLRRAALFLAPALLLPGLWMARNALEVGHFVISDRGGQVLWTRAELDRQIAREGMLPALLEWTPLEAARGAGRRLAPAATFDRYRWRGEGNFFTRSLRRWGRERELSADPIGADARLAGAALRRFFAQPGAHARATIAVGWRGIFVERAPAWLAALDLVVPIHALLACGWFLLLRRAAREHDSRPLALLAIPLGLFAVHALATEFLPRFWLPALPLIWAGFVAGLAGRASPEDRRPAS